MLLTQRSYWLFSAELSWTNPVLDLLLDLFVPVLVQPHPRFGDVLNLPGGGHPKMQQIQPKLA
jgi:hypothetical protein